MATISAKQQRVLDFIRVYTKENGYPPSVREICHGLQLGSTSTVHGYLKRLEKNGYLERNQSRSRSMKVIGEHWDALVSLPLVGSVKAGVPALAEETIEEYISLPAHFVNCSAEEAFILRVSGESMINAGILHNDSIIVHRNVEVHNGDIVVALIGDEATVKRFYKEQDCIRLQPENDFMEPIYAKEVTILGKVIGLLRRY